MFRFCRSKCHKSFKAKRNPRRVRWTKAYRKTHGKELTADPVYEFEKSRDSAVRYDRNVWVDTVQAMEKLDKIRNDRESRFWEGRMKNSVHHKKEMIKSNLIRNQTLIADPTIRTKVDQLREERDRKREERRNRNMNKNRDHNINLGLDQDMATEGEDMNKSIAVKENVKITNQRKKRIARKQKAMNLNRNIDMKKIKKMEELEVE
jgi:large subunit ribosomal protein L24e